MKQLPEWQKCHDTVTFVLEEAKKQGATAAEAASSQASGLSVTVRLNQVETLEFNQDKSLSLTVFRGKKKGSVTTTDISKQALITSVEAALRIAEYAEEDSFAGLADANKMPTHIPDLNLYHPWNISPVDAIKIAQECEEAARSFNPKIVNSEGASFSSHNRYRVYGNSHGFQGGYPGSKHSLSCIVIGQEGASMQRDYDYTVARDVRDLKSGTTIGKRAAEKTLKRLNGRKIKTMKAPVIFASEVASGLLGSFIAAISGGNLYRQSSFLLDHLEKPVFSDFVNIKESPHIPKGLASSPFDNEGVATFEHDIVSDGILKSYVLSSYSARKLGLQTTGNSGGVHNLLVSSNEATLNSLLKKMNTGLLVTELMGHGVNVVTGDYSRGASGFWVENGEIQYPVEEITIAGNLKDLFLNCVAIANDVDKRHNILTGSILLESMTIAGN